MAYEERYVAFIDLLGFANIVRQTETDSAPNRYDALVKSLTGIGSRIDADVDIGDNFRFQTFSDSIVMSSNVESMGLLHILDATSRLFISLLTEGLLMRGAIAKGKLHHDEEIMFGPAFLRAYDIEGRVAKYPRVILSPEVHEDVKGIKSARNPVFLLADDGPPFLHVFYDFHDLNKSQATPTIQSSEETQLAHTCHHAIQNLLDSSIHEPSHYEKLRWLAIYWNSIVQAGPGPLKQVYLPIGRAEEMIKLTMGQS